MLVACSATPSGPLFTPGPDDDAGTADAGADTARPDAPLDHPCDSSHKECGSACVTFDDPRFGCGRTSCDPCVIAHAKSTACRIGTCAIGACDPGYGDCDNEGSNGCESNLKSSPSNCGACGRACSGADVCSNGNCQATCDSGLTPCTGACVDLTSDADNCNACGKKCPAPGGAGEAACTRGQCGFTCDSGYHLCASACASNSDPATCGTACTPCLPPANGSATCNGVSCGVQCNVGYHQCNGQCASSSSTATCGTACTPCTPPANATATCDGLACGFACAAGYHRCGAACASDTSVTQCGAACTTCTPPANAAPVCTGGACDFTCNNGYRRVGNACVSNSNPTLTIASTVGAKRSGTFRLDPTVSVARLDAAGVCPSVTVMSTISNYQYVEVDNPTLQTASVSIWTSLAATTGAQNIDTIVAAYSSLPTTNAQRAACSVGVDDYCLDTSDTTSCFDEWAGLMKGDGRAVTIPPLGSVIVYVSAYYSTTSTQVHSGDYVLSARTESLL